MKPLLYQPALSTSNGLESIFGLADIMWLAATTKLSIFKMHANCTRVSTVASDTNFRLLLRFAA